RQSERLTNRPDGRCRGEAASVIPPGSKRRCLYGWRRTNKSRSRAFGQAGEDCVLFMLLELGVEAMCAPPGTPAVELLLYDRHYSLLATVQVKTTRFTNDRQGWMIARKQADRAKENHFYVFVDLNIVPTGKPTSYVVPSAIVADLC